MPLSNFGAVDPAGFLLNGDNTQLGMEIDRAKRKYMLPPTKTPDMTPGGVIMNPATGQLEDKNGTPVVQVRRQALKPGQSGGIDTGSGPTQYVSADGKTPLAGMADATPRADGSTGYAGPSFDSGFTAAGGGGSGAKYKGNPGADIMGVTPAPADAPKTFNDLFTGAGAGSAAPTLPDGVSPAEHLLGVSAPVAHSNVNSEQSFTGANTPAGHLLLPSVDEPFRGEPGDPRNGKYYNYLGGGWMGTEPAVNDFARQEGAAALFDQKKQIIDQDAQNKLAIANIEANARIYGADKDYEAAIAKAGAKTADPIAAYTVANPDPSLTGEAALKNYTPQVQAYAKQLVEGRIPYPNAFALKLPVWQAAIKAANDIDPEYNASNHKVREATRKSFTSGADAKNINSINTLVGHLGSLQESADKLGNTGSPLYNKVGNYLSANTVGNPALRDFNMKVGAVEGELAAVFKGTGATDQEIKAWRDRISASQTPDELKADISAAVELMGSRLTALQNKYQAGMGNIAQGLQILSPKSRGILSKMGVDVNQLEPGNITAKNDTASGPMNDLPPAAAHAGRKIRDTATGQMLVSNGTSWVPAQ